MIKVDVKRTRIWVPRGRELAYTGKRTTHAWVGAQTVNFLFLSRTNTPPKFNAETHYMLQCMHLQVEMMRIM